MIKRLFTILILIWSIEGYAQTDTIFGFPADSLESDTAWKIGGNFSLQFNQAAYSNWQAGGINSISGNALFDVFANYEKGIWAWKNRLSLGYGMTRQDTLSSKTDDRIELESRLDRAIGENWSLSTLLTFNTQFTDGYEPPGVREDSTKISGFMAPAYLLYGVGFTYKPTSKFNAYISPLTLKVTIVNDERLSGMGAYGVDTGSTSRYEIGGYLNLSYLTPIMENVDFQARLDLYSNYLDNQYDHIDVHGEMLLFMKVNRYLTANFSFAVAYDHDIIFDTNNDGISDGPRTQFKEVIGVGLSYKFGYQPGE